MVSLLSLFVPASLRLLSSPQTSSSLLSSPVVVLNGYIGPTDARDARAIQAGQSTGSARISTLLPVLLFLPFVTAGALFITSGGRSTASLRNTQYNVTLISAGLSVILSILLWAGVSGRSAGTGSAIAGFRATFSLPLVPSIGGGRSAVAPLRFGVDGLSLLFVLLTTLVTYLCILSLSPLSTPRLLEALLALLLLQGAVVRTFLSLDLLAFFLGFERSLLPIYFLVLLWGSRERRVRASYLISIYTLLGSVFRFFTLLYLASKAGTTDFDLLSALFLAEHDQRLLWAALFVAFAAKIPLFPLHIWLPEAHVEAPTVGSVLLAALLLKLGTYGLVRFALPLFPAGTVFFAPLVATFAVRGVVYTGLTALRQIDLKKIIAYASVGHRNVVLLGRRAETSEGLQGALFQRLSHGVVSGALFFAVGSLYERYAVRSLKYFGGLAHLYPILTRLFLLFSLANRGFPLTSAFVGEFLLFLGITHLSVTATRVAATSRVLGAASTLWAANRIFFGNLRTLTVRGGQDISRKERAVFGPLAALTLVGGIAPQPVLDTLLVDTRLLLEQARRGRLCCLAAFCFGRGTAAAVLCRFVGFALYIKLSADFQIFCCPNATPIVSTMRCVNAL